MWLFLLSVSASFAQAYEASPCEGEPALATELASGRVETLTPVGPRYVLTRATSVREPSADTPLDFAAARSLVQTTGLLLTERGGLRQVARDLRSCTWGGTQLVDGERATAWCEGAPGSGVGEAVLVPMPKGKQLEVLNGHAASVEAFRASGRVRRIEVVVLGEGQVQPVQGIAYEDLPVLARHEVDLADHGRWQPLPLPDLPSGARPAWVALRIVAATPEGSTCLSEIRAAR